MSQYARKEFYTLDPFEALEKVLTGYITSEDLSLRYFVIHQLKQKPCLHHVVTLVLVVFAFVSFGSTEQVDVLVSSALMLLVFSCSFLSIAWTVSNRRKEVLHMGRQALKGVRKVKRSKEPLDDKNGRFISVKRNQKVQKLPLNLLVPGDEVLLKDTAEFPFLKVDGIDEKWCKVMNFPSLDQLKQTVERTPRPSVLENQISRGFLYLQWMALVSLSISLVMVIIRLGRIDSPSSRDVLFGLVYQNVLLLVTVTFPFLDLQLMLLKSGANALLLSQLNGSYWVKEFASILWSPNQSGQRGNSGLVESLGSITTVCFLDKEGVLSETSAVPEHLLVFRDNKPVVVDCTSSDISDDRFPIEFEGDWKVLDASLRPLGLSSLFCGQCRKPGSSLETSDSKNRFPVTDLQKFPTGGRISEFSDCLCLVGKAVGFDVKQIENQYHMHHSLQTLSKENNLQRSMEAVAVISESTSSMQLFSRGEPSLVLEHCGWLWDGKSIAELNAGLRKKIQQISSRWKHDDLKIYALAYTPVPHHHEDILTSDHSGLVLLSDESIPSFVFPEDEDSTGELSSSEDEEDVLKNIWTRRRRRKESWTLDSDIEPPVEDESEILRRLQSGQIFLGLVCTRKQPRPGIGDLVEDLQKAGIRFVHFSELNRKRSVAFAEKMGLDTDWNFFISLKDPHPIDMHKIDKHNISKLPVGVSSIRQHIETVDNVPLLVSLFTDSSCASERQVIGILQDYGETVLCIGSDCKPENTLVFSQSDFAIGVRPLEEANGCLLDFEEESHTVGLLEKVSGQFTTMPCGFHLKAVDLKEKTLSLIANGRNGVWNISQSMLLFISVTLTVHFAILFNIIFASPPITELYHLIWLHLVLLPIICFALLFVSRPHEKCLNTIAGKNENPLPHTALYLSWILVRILPTSVIFALLFQWELSEAIGESAFDVLVDERVEGVYSKKTQIAQVQSYMMLVLVYWIWFIAGGYLYRNRSLWLIADSSKRTLTVFAVACLSITVLQLIWTVLQVSLSATPYSLSSEFIVVAVLWPIAIVCLDELWKSKERQHQYRLQRRLRIVFDTKLGMHSPK